jgi:hypothetical protein
VDLGLEALHPVAASSIFSNRLAMVPCQVRDTSTPAIVRWLASLVSADARRAASALVRSESAISWMRSRTCSTSFCCCVAPEATLSMVAPSAWLVLFTLCDEAATSRELCATSSAARWMCSTSSRSFCSMTSTERARSTVSSGKRRPA